MAGETVLVGLEALAARRQRGREHQAQIAARRYRWIERNRYFYALVANALRFIVEPKKRVLHIRSSTGWLLKALEPSRALGVELTDKMIDEATRLNPEAEYRRSDPEDFLVDEVFDYVVVESVNDVTDVLPLFENLRKMSDRHTRVVVYTQNNLWGWALKLAERVGLRAPTLEQNWLSENDIRTLLHLGGFETVRVYRIALFPFFVPLLSWFANVILARLPLLNRLTLINLLVARPQPSPVALEDLTVSVIVPCRNEKGNIEDAVRRMPQLGQQTEIIFCDDKSTDGTGDEVLRVKAEYPDHDIRLVDGPGINKANNVWAGFRAARGDVLMILDADLAVMPEELPYFAQALASGKGEFINGVRLVYPLPKAAMKTFNRVGNKVFSWVFSALLGQPVKDTLCGTKVLWRADWPRFEPLLASWGPRDRWGDFELLFSASKLNLRIVDLPVHYQERVAGVSKMVKVVGNGVHMVRLSAFAFFRLKFGY